MSSQDTETQAATSKSTIHFIVLPKQCENHTRWDEMIEKFKRFRLYALGESPEAFASTLAVEKAFAQEIWAGRLNSPRATHGLAVDYPNAADIKTDSGKTEALLNNEWIAQTVLIEVVEGEVAKLAADKSPWNHNPQHGPQLDSHRTGEERVVFVLSGIYVTPQYRQGGIGANMIAASIDEGIRIARSRGLPEVQFQVRVDADNLPAVKLYERASFQCVGTEQLVMGEKERNGVKIPPRAIEVLVLHRHISLK
ncbi:hypothetical protein BLS_009533 [Venturia inaequalis]|uniref:N-acetyltransferase domain-containing protein n=1 Tax=Venturia inaequalis TaxID=5025 RepID=A0A8H3VG98_VENIN|nr:hypothetical protein EG328_005839 [Venturia inaequalis]KAE9979720.1 hypothetical protein BLS_009533 [Venturia inaequalis]KAE9987390.1 hypothetical protein EG327_003836 [Venturia inaequalis]RDI76809.1 Cutinase transcription factor 1 beta [Venturia inaequalis]